MSHLPQIFGISDLIIVAVCVGAICLGIWGASLYSREVYEQVNGHRRQSNKKAPLNAVEVFEQLNGASRFQYSDISKRYIGIRIKAVGRLGRSKKLSGDLMALSVIPSGVTGYVNAGVSWSEYHAIVSRKSEGDVTLEGKISYMDLDHTHELFLSDAKLCV